jgi:hypothetical protein
MTLPWSCKKRDAGERFQEKIAPDAESGCHIWQGGKNKKGYGTFGVTPKNIVLAHRFAWERVNGAIPAGLFVLHRCDTPSCVNPDHLFLGTAAENTADMAQKWRTRSKLGPEDVLTILHSPESNRQLARRYGLKSHKSISNIKNGKTFALVTP